MKGIIEKIIDRLRYDDSPGYDDGGEWEAKQKQKAKEGIGMTAVHWAMVAAAFFMISAVVVYWPR